MPYVPVHRDLSRVKTKVVFNLTKRQLLCFGLAALVGVPIYFLIKAFLGNTVGVIVMIVAMLPFFFLAMFERDGQPAEKILQSMLRHKKWPKQRPYLTENLYATLSKKEESHIALENKKAGKTRKAPARKHKAGQD